MCNFQVQQDGISEKYSTNYVQEPIRINLYNNVQFGCLNILFNI